MSKKGWYWPWLLGIAMSGIVGVNVAMLFAANSDRNGVVVEPDYYRKAVQWDSTMALQEESARLGWQAAVTLTPRAAGDSAPTVEVLLRDATGAGVSGAAVRAELIHNIDANRRVDVTLRDLGEGRYGAAPALTHAGLWEVRVNAERAGGRFAAIAHTDLAPLPAVH